MQGLTPNTPNNCDVPPINIAAAFGHVEVLQVLLKEGKVNPNTPNEYGTTPLMAAVCWANENLQSIITLLLTAGADPSTKDNKENTAAYYAKSPEIKEILMKAEKEHAQKKAQEDLFKAARSGNIQALRKALNAGANPNTPNNCDVPPINIAAAFGHVEVLQVLLKEGKVNPNTPPNNPLYVAAKYGHIDALQFLIKKCNANPNTPNEYGTTPLMAAVCWANENLQSIITLLLTAGADPSTKDNKENTAAYYAKSPEIKEILMKAEKEHAQKKAQEDLFKAARSGDVETLTAALKAGANPNTPNHLGTPTYIAAFYSQVDALRFLTTEGKANPNTTTNNGTTPLMAAVRWAKKNIHIQQTITLLLAAGADPSAKDHKGNTAADYAAPEIKEILMKAEKEHAQKIEKTQKELFKAAEKGDDNALIAAINAGASPNSFDEHGNTPAHIAAYNGNVDALRFLITECKTNPNTPNKDGNTPAHIAACNGNVEALRILITEGKANPNTPNNDGETPVYIAAKYGNVDALRFLITKCKADPNTSPDYQKNTPVFIAALHGHIAVLRCLIEEGKADPKTPNEYGYTPLKAAMVWAPPELRGATIYALLALGADATEIEISLRQAEKRKKENTGNSPAAFFSQKKPSETTFHSDNEEVKRPSSQR